MSAIQEILADVNGFKAISTLIFAHGILASLPPQANYDADETIRQAKLHTEKYVEYLEELEK